MQEDDLKATVARPLRLIALVALLLPYLISGVMKLIDFDAASAEVAALTGLASTPLVAILAAAVVVTQLLGSAMLLTGGRFGWLGGIALAGFTLIATFLAHTWWHLPQGAEREHAFNGFWEHIALVGGLVFASICSWASEA